MTKAILVLVLAAMLALGCTSAGPSGSKNNSTVKGEGQIVDVGGSIPAGSGSSDSGIRGMNFSESGDEVTLNSTTHDQGDVQSGGSIGMGK